MFSGGSLPKFEKSKSKKRASVNHTAAASSSKASAVDLVDEDDDHLDKHATTDGHVLEAVYASVAFTAAQPVEIDATAVEAAAASKAATAAHEAAAKAACTPSEEDDLPKKSSGGTDPKGTSTTMSDGFNPTNALKPQALGMFFTLICNHFFLSLQPK